MSKIIHTDKEITIMSELKAKPALGQRELAQKSGISLGMVNTIIQRLVERGWVKVQKASPKNVQYLLTPAGMREFAQRSYHLVKNIYHHVVEYSSLIDYFFEEFRQLGYKHVHFKESTQLDFLFKRSADKYGIKMTSGSMPVLDDNVLIITPETLADRGFLANSEELNERKTDGC